MPTALHTGKAEADLAKARSLARQYAALTRKRFGKRLRGMRLYGSAARGDWATDSDIDVLVLLDTVRNNDVDWLSRQAIRLGVLDNGLLLQPLPMAEGRFVRLRQRERRFALDVDHEGISL